MCALEWGRGGRLSPPMRIAPQYLVVPRDCSVAAAEGGKVKGPIRFDLPRCNSATFLRQALDSAPGGARCSECPDQIHDSVAINRHQCPTGARRCIKRSGKEFPEIWMAGA